MRYLDRRLPRPRVPFTTRSASRRTIALFPSASRTRAISGAYRPARRELLRFATIASRNVGFFVEAQPTITSKTGTPKRAAIAHGAEESASTSALYPG